MRLIQRDEKLMATCQASHLAYQLRNLIAVTYCAYDTEDNSIPMHNRGIEGALEIAEKMSCDLIDRCEELERTIQKQAKVDM